MLDDLPISGKGSYLNCLEEEEGCSQDKERYGSQARVIDEDAEESGPLAKRLESKNWKTRARAYEDLVHSLTSGPDTVPLDLAIHISKYLSDSNPAAQEKSLEVAKVYLIRSPDSLLPHNESISRAVIEKVLISSKSNIKSEASAFLLDFFSVHKDNFEGFFAGIIFCITNKNVKVQAAGITSATLLLNHFGAKKVPFKSFVGFIEKAAGASNPSVRTEAMNFYKECFRWVRELINPFVEKLKKSQQDELKAAFGEINEIPVPSRWLKSEENLSRAEKTPVKNQKIDVYDMADAKDIFSKYGEKWVNTVLAFEKWTDKKQALEELNNEANYPKLAEKNPIELVTLAKRLINDSNLQVTLQAIKLVGLLAKGQRKYFESYAKQFFPVIIQKYKDKKTQVLTEANFCLDNLLFSFSFDSILEDLRLALEDPNPLVKSNTCLWVEKVVENNQAELKGVARVLAGICKKNTDDSSPEVRNSSFKLISSLLKKFPEIVQPLLKDLPASKLKKLEDCEKNLKPEEKKIEKIDICKSSTPSKSEEKKEPKTPQPKKPPLKDSSKTPSKPQGEDEDLTIHLSNEEVESQMISLLPSEILKQLKETTWKEKQSGLQSLQQWARLNVNKLPGSSESLLKFIRMTVKDWKENNFNVVKAAIESFQVINELTPISKKAGFGVLTASALDKFSDGKLSEVLISCIMSLAETLGPKFVVSSIVKGTSDCSKPKVLTESSSCICKIISEYGVHTINLKELVDFTKAALAQANPSIKKAGQGLAVLLFSFLGDKLLPMLSDIKEATLKVLQEEFSKTQIQSKSSFKSFKGQESQPDMKKALEDLFPRANIEKLLTPALLKKLSDNNWKTRKEALDEFEGILDSNSCRVLTTGLENAVKGLVGRLSDPNKAVVRQVLLLSGKLAGSLGADSKVFAKQMLPGILTCLADKQNLLRQDALNAINKWAEEAGFESVILYAAGPLATDNPELRSELLKWLIEQKHHFRSLDMKIYVQGTLACLQDRNALIRNLAESFYSEIVEIVGFEAFQVYLKDIKPAILNTLMPVLEKYKGKDENLPKNHRNAGSVQERVPVKEVVRKKSVISARSEDVKSPIKKSRTFLLSSLEISIVNVGNKEKRLEIEAKFKWSVEDFRPEFLERTKEQARQVFSNDLFNFLCNSDFKKQVEGVAYLQNLILSEKKNASEIVDILFKWTWLTLQENANTQLHKAIFEMLQVLINTLSDLQYYLHDIEAGLFYPIICEKSGNPNFKQTIRGLLHSSVSIYPTDKVFSFILQGCSSKNAKSKVECLEELSSLIQDFGLNIIQSKDVKAIIKQVSSLDNIVRTAALQTMAEIFKLAGEKTWSMTGEVSDKVRDLLDQRFKVVSATTGRRMSSRDQRDSLKKEPSSPKSLFSKTREAQPEASGNVTDRESLKPEKKSLLTLTLKRKPTESFDRREPKSPNFASSKRFGSSESRSLVSESKNLSFGEKAKLEKKEEKIDSCKSTDFFTKRTIQTFEKKLERKETEAKSYEIQKNFNFSDISADKAQTLLSVDQPETPVITEESMLYESFKIEDPFTSELDKNLEILKNSDISSKVDALVAINDLILNFESNKEELQQKANSISEALTRVLITTFEKPVDDIPLRFAKYFLNVLNKVCSTRAIIRELTETSLYMMVEQVLSRLLIEELEKMGDKGEGEMMLKTLNGTMLRLLDHSAPSKMTIVLIRLLSKYRGQNRFLKMPGMITRCLMKIMKNLQVIIQQIEVGKVFLAMHEYLIQVKNSLNDDLGVKTLKSFLVEIVKVQGNAVWSSYEFVRQHHAPDLLIEKWILSALNVSVNPFVEVQPKVDPVVADVVELIKYDFDAGVKKLDEQLQKNPKVEISVYLALMGNKMSAQVTEALKDLRETKKEEKDEASAGYNFQEFQKRLTIMKQRYGISNTASQIEINSTLSDLKHKVNTLLNKPAVPDDQELVNELRTRIQKLNRTNK
jgi:cytoskeleton-associated protein 5